MLGYYFSITPTGFFDIQSYLRIFFALSFQFHKIREIFAHLFAGFLIIL